MGTLGGYANAGLFLRGGGNGNVEGFGGWRSGGLWGADGKAGQPFP